MYSILVCDDEKDIVSALKIYLMADGYQVFEAYNGKEALEVLKEQDVYKRQFLCLIMHCLRHSLFLLSSTL